MATVQSPGAPWLLEAEHIVKRYGQNEVLNARAPAQLQSLRSRASMVFQHFNLWAHMTALQSVTEAPVQALLAHSRKSRVRDAA